MKNNDFSFFFVIQIILYIVSRLTFLTLSISLFTKQCVIYYYIQFSNYFDNIILFIPRTYSDRVWYIGIDL